jgi:hypothetical protein
VAVGPVAWRSCVFLPCPLLAGTCWLLACSLLFADVPVSPPFSSYWGRCVQLILIIRICVRSLSYFTKIHYILSLELLLAVEETILFIPVPEECTTLVEPSLSVAKFNYGHSDIKSDEKMGYNSWLALSFRIVFLQRYHFNHALVKEKCLILTSC